MENKLQLYKIDADYLKYMHKIDYRLSVKYNNRPFVGIIIMVNESELLGNKLPSFLLQPPLLD